MPSAKRELCNGKATPFPYIVTQKSSTILKTKFNPLHRDRNRNDQNLVACPIHHLSWFSYNYKQCERRDSKAKEKREMRKRQKRGASECRMTRTVSNNILPALLMFLPFRSSTDTWIELFEKDDGGRTSFFPSRRQRNTAGPGKATNWTRPRTNVSGFLDDEDRKKGGGRDFRGRAISRLPEDRDLQILRSDRCQSARHRCPSARKIDSASIVSPGSVARRKISWEPKGDSLPFCSSFFLFWLSSILLNVDLSSYPSSSCCSPSHCSDWFLQRTQDTFLSSRVFFLVFYFFSCRSLFSHPLCLTIFLSLSVSYLPRLFSRFYVRFEVLFAFPKASRSL